mgnify:CR=1 FL=1
MYDEFDGFDTYDFYSRKKLMNFIVESDEMRIKQIIMNLMSNALKFTKSGGRVRVKTSYVRSVLNYKKYKEQNRSNQFGKLTMK